MATLVEDDPKAPFSIATIPRRRRRCYSIPWIAPLYPWSVPFNAECSARQRQVPFFESLVWLKLEIKPWSPGPLANTLPIWPMARIVSVYMVSLKPIKMMFHLDPYYLQLGPHSIKEINGSLQYWNHFWNITAPILLKIPFSCFLQNYHYIEKFMCSFDISNLFTCVPLLEIINIWGLLNKFPDIFIWALLLIVQYIHETLVPFEVISSGWNTLGLPFQQLLEGPMEVL